MVAILLFEAYRALSCMPVCMYARGICARAPSQVPYSVHMAMAMARELGPGRLQWRNCNGHGAGWRFPTVGPISIICVRGGPPLNASA